MIVPTLGRPTLVAAVLDDLRRQTVRPSAVIVVDQNGEGDGGPYDGFADLPLTVIRQSDTGQWLARNAALQAAQDDLLLFLDDDSRIGLDFVERHLEGLASYRADISAGASLSVVGAPVPESYAFFRAADQFDSGNALVRRQVLARVGGFDRQYDRMRGGDADFGTRVYLTGGLAVHNPRAARSHLKAAEGGLRSFGSWDSFRQLGHLSPKPLPSVVYYLRRWFSPRQVREALLIGLVQAAVPYHLKRRASPRQWAGFLASEAVRLPLTAVRVARSLRAARRMLAAGPHIPAVAPPSSVSGAP
ncbi:MAG TPA: glycosyltransferase [Acidimicrobiales bacterium]|nr:glycosyltransferase [Acidimicrobiales bacterium]